ncbi:MAG: hypothetical protein H6815_02070 [Phycisphaeraceae bacterium]|nr:hypothetical protein [Phycisphaerales bacterium]MCB9859214.1 hypothetical protein [Phycisphaeraceae bacterium]
MKAAVSLILTGITTTPVLAQYDYHDWTANLTNSNNVVKWNFTNTSSAGTITGESVYPGFVAGPGSWGMPTAITNQGPFATGFQINGATSTSSFAEFAFSTGYAWGSGGRMILGNIHNHYEYEIAAWDFANNPIDVNTWQQIGPEYASTAPGSSGYFSTSSTQRSANGLASRFYVSDTSADPNLGQGGVILLGGLQNVGKIRMTLTNSLLAPNAQAVDLMFMWIGTPIPSPGPLALMGIAGVTAAWRQRR